MTVQQQTMATEQPLLLQRADPWVYKHEDGFYYFTASVPEYDRIEVRRASTIAGLADAEPVTAWRKRPAGMMSANIWAPEIHCIDGKWYIYFAAARTTETNDGLFDHRMFVLENTAANPLEGEWTEKGQIKTMWESFALDATTFEHRGTRYLVWAQKDPDIQGNSNLYIAPLANPWTLAADGVMLTKPEYDWETIGFLVNEGPAVIKHDGRLFISYSGSATNHHYCMGLLEASEDANPMDPASWTKSAQPVLKMDESRSLFGPGHNSFTKSEDGQDDILVFHARTYKEIVGDPLYDPNRHTFVRKLRWSAEGKPIFE
ncbi:family 43 glycosylhydrolase [Cohnella suwonensis]|uniref:Family 43 glycosylhydrolase n=1 Tax=Cohnella suwonensis TaxID=696072 RepID=A0ABW0LSB5_9BACL